MDLTDNIETMAVSQLNSFPQGVMPGGINIPASLHSNPDILVEGDTETLRSGQIQLCMTRQPKEHEDIVQSKYFELEICLVDKSGAVVHDIVNKLPLQVLLLYEDLTWVDQQNLIELDPKTPAIIDREGYARLRVRILDISRVHSRRKFVVYVSAANETLTLGIALSRPMFVLSRKSKKTKPNEGAAESALAEKPGAEPYMKALMSGAATAGKGKSSPHSPLKTPAAKRIKTEPSFGGDVKAEITPAVNVFMAAFGTLEESERRAALAALAQQMSNAELKCVVCEFLSRPEKQ